MTSYIYPSYSDYVKPTEPWIDRYPIGWSLTRVKFESYVKARVGWHGLKSDDFTDEGPYLVTGSDFKGKNIVWKDCYHCDEERYEQDPYIQLVEGDLLITKDGTIGKLALVESLSGKATLNSGVFVVRPLKGNYETHFYYWLLQSSVFTGFVDLNKTGSTIVHLYQDTFVNFKYASPSMIEQESIANFINHETAKIDTLIDKQQQLIKLLKEKRQAVISHAVTKGLNPDAPMKDSGVEWLGEVPEHWVTPALKYMCELLKDGTHLPPPRVDEGIPLLSVRNLIRGRFVFRDDDSKISMSDYEKLKDSFEVHEGDVLLAVVGATLGKTAIVDKMEPFHIQRSVAVFRCKKSLFNNRYLNLIFQSKQFDELLWENVGFSAQPGIYLGTLSGFRVPAPPYDEQVKIVQIVTAKLAGFDKLLTVSAKKIDLLKERRIALISAAVTGKIDVRNWQPAQEQKNM